MLSCPRDHLAKRLPSRHFSSCICLIEAKSSALNTVRMNWIHFVRRSMMPCQGARPPIRWRGDINAASSSERRSIIVLLQDYVRVLVQVEAHAKCMQRYTVFRVYGLVVSSDFFPPPPIPKIVRGPRGEVAATLGKNHPVSPQLFLQTEPTQNGKFKPPPKTLGLICTALY